MSKSRRKTARRSRVTRSSVVRNGSERSNGEKSITWLNRDLLFRLLWVFAFIVAVTAVCFVEQSPPSLKVLPRVIARESVYSDRSFDYESKILTELRREEAAKSTPRVYSRNKTAEDRFKAALIAFRNRLGEIIGSEQGEPGEVTALLLKGLTAEFSVEVDPHEGEALLLIKEEAERERVFNDLIQAVDEINALGILETRSEYHRFLSFDEAETELKAHVREITQQLVVVGGAQANQDLLLALDLVRFEEEFPALRAFLADGNFTYDSEPFPEDGLKMADLLAAEEAEVRMESETFAHQFEEAFFSLSRKGLWERHYDEAATEERAKTKLDSLPQVQVKVSEGELIIRKGERITLESHEKYQAYRDMLRLGNELLHERVLLSLGIFLVLLSFSFI